MKKYTALLAVFSLVFGLFVSQVFAAGSASGGSTVPDKVVNDTAVDAVVETEASVETNVETSAAETSAEVKVESESNTELKTDSSEDDSNVVEAVLENVTEANITAESKVEASAELDLAESTSFCFELADRKERIKCRLGKSAAEIKVELEQNFMPEECAAMADDHKKELCTTRYKAVQPCWAEAHGPKRIACVKEVLEIDKVQRTDKYCEGKEKGCAKAYRWKVYNLITFRFYDAEERAEIWHSEGHLSLDDTVVFVDLVVDAKIRFYNGKTMAEKMDAIETVQEAWAEVVVKVKASKGE